MFVDKCGSEKPALRLFLTAIVVLVLSGLITAQDAATTPPASKPADIPAQTNQSVRSDSYVIGADDVLSIYVWKEPEMSKGVPVRPDGMISLPLIGEIKAAGNTPVQLQGILADAMKKYVADPQVTVIVDKISSLTFNMVGEIGKPGSYPLTRRITVLDAIAMAGGFKDFAKTKKIYILRTSAGGTEQKLPFNYNEVIKGKNPQQNIELQPRDTIVVP